MSGSAMVLRCVRSTVIVRLPYTVMSLNVNLIRPDGVITVVCACVHECWLITLCTTLRLCAVGEEMWLMSLAWSYVYVLG